MTNVDLAPLPSFKPAVPAGVFLLFWEVVVVKEEDEEEELDVEEEGRLRLLLGTEEEEVEEEEEEEVVSSPSTLLFRLVAMLEFFVFSYWHSSLRISSIDQFWIQVATKFK